MSLSLSKNVAPAMPVAASPFFLLQSPHAHPPVWDVSLSLTSVLSSCIVSSRSLVRPAVDPRPHNIQFQFPPPYPPFDPNLLQARPDQTLGAAHDEHMEIPPPSPNSSTALPPTNQSPHLAFLASPSASAIMAEQSCATFTSCLIPPSTSVTFHSACRSRVWEGGAIRHRTQTEAADQAEGTLLPHPYREGSGRSPLPVIVP